MKNCERLELFDYVKLKIPNFYSLSSRDKFIWLMTCENEDILNRYGQFVNTCFTLRG